METANFHTGFAKPNQPTTEPMEPTTAMKSAEETITPLCGVLMYEDRDAHARALNLYAHLAIEVAKDIPIEFTWWAMPVLQSPKHAAAAHAAVQLADMVIIAARPGADWPPAFKAWIDSWALPAEKKLGALGALFLPASNGSKGMSGRHVYLQYIAAKLNLDFLAAPAESTAGILKSKLGLSPAAKPGAPEVYQTPDRPDYSPYCGING
jgi:hypothetical protein